MRGHRRLSLLGGLAIGMVACGRLHYHPQDALRADALLDPDASGVDAWTSDVGLDASSLDASIDARSMIDGAGIDAQAGDAWVPDPRDAFSDGCRVRWTARLASSGDDSIAAPWLGEDGLLYVPGSGAVGATFAGGGCTRCLIGFSRDGAPIVERRSEPGATVWASGSGVAAAVGLFGDRHEVTSYATPSFATRGLLGTLRFPGGGTTSGSAFRVGGTSVLYAHSLDATMMLDGGPTWMMAGMGVAMARWNDGMLAWSMALDWSGDQHLREARMLPDLSTGIALSNLGGASGCFGPAGCVPSFSEAAITIAADGSVSDVVPVAVGHLLTVTDDHGALARDPLGGPLRRLSRTGAELWSRPMLASGGAVVEDAARGRFVIFLEVGAGATYDGTSLVPSTADVQGLAIVEIDRDTGMLGSSFVFGSDANDTAWGLIVDSTGRTYVRATVQAPVALCSEMVPHAGGRDALLLALD